MTPFPPAFASRDHFTKDGVPLFVRVFGTGPRHLLVVHGGPDWDHSYLLPPMPMLAAGTVVAMFDLRGCGRSATVDPAGYQPDLAAEDVGRVVDELGWDDFSLLGFSYGGHLALRFVMSHPERVDRLVLASTGVRDGSQELRSLPEYRKRARNIDLSFLDDLDLAPAEKTRRMAVAGHPLDIHDLALAPRYLELLDGVTFSGEWMRAWRAGTMTSPLVDDPLDHLRAFGKPVLMLHGEHDLRYPLVLTASAAESVPNARLVVIPGAGHMAHFEATQTWARAVAQFLGP